MKTITAKPVDTPIEKDEVYVSEAPRAVVSREQLTADPRLSQMIPAKIVGNNVTGEPREPFLATTLECEGQVSARSAPSVDQRHAREKGRAADARHDPR